MHRDHLGSARLLTSMTKSIVQNLVYLPFGENNSTDSGITTHEFTGDERDSETSLDHTLFRQYSSQFARWTSPDPAGLAAVDPSNPQSWNRYAYVLNNPLKFVDPFGLDCVFLNNAGDGIESVDQFAFVDECLGNGGYFVDGSVTQVSISADTSTISLTGTTDGTNQTGSFYQQFGSNLDSSAGSGIPADGCGFSYLNGGLLGTQCGGQFTPYQPSVTETQRIQAVAKGANLAAHVIPVPCGGGVFGFAGPEGERGAGGVLVEYDSQEGLSINGFGEVSSPATGAGGGAFSNGKNGINPFVFVPLAEAGGAVAFKGGVGLYVGAAAGHFGYGGGAYVNITSAAACK